MKYVIYDFNGTVLDDVEVCIKAENKTIAHFGLNRRPLTLDEYLHIFTFPVKKYYEIVGFDWSKNSYEEVGQYWFDWYNRLKDEYFVHEGVLEVLKENKAKGNRNILLSASSLNALKKQLEELGLSSYFDEVLGIDNIYAGSKIEIALEWIKDRNPKDCLMIGDTLHDLETAKAMGVEARQLQIEVLDAATKEPLCGVAIKGKATGVSELPFYSAMPGKVTMDVTFTLTTGKDGKAAGYFFGASSLEDVLLVATADGHAPKRYELGATDFTQVYHLML